MESGPPDPPAHTHRLPGGVRAAILGLGAAVLLLLIAVGLMASAVYQANQYVEGRGEFRDREADRIEQAAIDEVRRAACDILAALPADGAVLDQVRAQFDCGPGVP